MSVITDTWRQLVRRRLWPVALLLVGALVAVPMLLAKDPEPVPTPPVAGGTKVASAADADPVVALASAEEARRRRVLGASKDPFEPAPMARPRAAATPSTETPVPAASAPSGGSTAPSFDVPPLQTLPQLPDTPKKIYPLYTLTVRFGPSDQYPLPKSKVEQLDAMPSADEPVLVYLGVSDKGKGAVFMVDSDVVAQGDGSCKPDDAQCETIELHEGDTEFFDVTDPDTGQVSAQYQLDLVDIKNKQTTSAKEARSQFARVSKHARKAARARVAARARRAMAGGFDINR
jgi:hypothetical protein